jgi:DNA polymerase elongation subunit (family B)
VLKSKNGVKKPEEAAKKTKDMMDKKKKNGENLDLEYIIYKNDGKASERVAKVIEDMLNVK